MSDPKNSLSHLPPPVVNRLSSFVTALKRRKICGSFVVAKETSNILRDAVCESKWTNASESMTAVHNIGLKLMEANPLEVVIGNIVRRILFIIREEYEKHKKELEDTPGYEPPPSSSPSTPAASSSISLTASMNIAQATHTPDLTSILASSHTEQFNMPFDVQQNISDSIMEMTDELDNLYYNVANQALEHIHANEVVMTVGRSTTTEEFLKYASRKRKFQVIVAESAPSFAGHSTARSLSDSGIDTTLISDGAVFAMMSRVNKVIIGAHAVLANGGLLAHSGIRVLAQAAKHHSVPVLVCCGLYKLCPIFLHDQDSLTDFISPSSVLSFDEADVGEGQLVQVCNPAYDYVPPDLVSIFVTNNGGHNPSYIYRLLNEFYCPEDYDLI
eukprot:TRINITY_DN5452_c0_g3_i1.p1 TRINITY_DN5452_c0_g3~~TRINITY_DN5452_c0_g3_i1.p1  ORF type:complete len:409 (+),score=105.66 TRINITY_DN5452_c0_g3_i1:67-1227(+)